MMLSAPVLILYSYAGINACHSHIIMKIDLYIYIYLFVCRVCIMYEA